jgi:hypothetical protein
MSTNPLLQTIEALAKEKGIEPDVVIQAMEEAVLTASRKFYKTNEEPEGAVQHRERPGGAVRGEDHRGRGHQPRPRDLGGRGQGHLRRGGRGRGRLPDRVPEEQGKARAHRRADGQAGHLPEASARPSGATSSTSSRRQEVGEADHRHGEALRAAATSSSSSGAPRRSCRARAVPRRERTPSATASSDGDQDIVNVRTSSDRRSSCRAPTRRCW